MPNDSADLSSLSDGELLDLAVPSDSLSRRVLVMWLYLKEGKYPEMTLQEFDLSVTSAAEKELQKRAISKAAGT